MVERVDRIKPLKFDSVPWTDLPMWEEFFAFAIAGGDFKYYPDATASAFQTCELVEDQIQAQFSSRGLSKLSFNFRVVPGAPSFP